MSDFSTKAKLQEGLSQLCADDITEVLCNLADGTCDYVGLIPLLEKVAQIDLFYYFDDNGAGGLPRASGEPQSFRQWALQSIENIKENKQFEADSYLADELKSIHNQMIKSALKKIADGNCADEKLIPILEKIAKKNEYSSYSYIGGFSQPQMFGEMALRAIQKIKNNIEADKTKN